MTKCMMYLYFWKDAARLQEHMSCYALFCCAVWCHSVVLQCSLLWKLLTQEFCLLKLHVVVITHSCCCCINLNHYPKSRT